ncbi:ABC-three component system middle component 6 [Bacillus mycoides]|uniref:ABC-three component system middle component 6 n=1 Tax=Bacillus mycoides TaxID=1405 RepID=UPI003CFF1D70
MFSECFKGLEEITIRGMDGKRDFVLLEKKGGDKMLTPTKNLHEDRTILKIGARILSFLTSPRTVSTTWKKYLDFQNNESVDTPRIQFDMFILALDFLYIIGAIEYEDDLLWRAKYD